MVPLEAPGDEGSTVLYVTVVRGHAEQTSLPFERGQRAELTVGSRGDWQVAGPGVVPVHLRLAFDGTSLFACAADGLARVGGQQLGAEWSRLKPGDELRLGFALLRVELTDSRRRATAPRASSRVPTAARWVAGGLAALLLVASGLRLAGDRARAGADAVALPASAKSAPSTEPAPVAAPPANPEPAVVSPSENAAPEPRASPLTLSVDTDRLAQGRDEQGPSDPTLLPPPQRAIPQNIANRPIPRVGETPSEISREWRQHHERTLRFAGRTTTRVIFLGDSITEGWATAPSYREHFSQYAPVDLGITGDTTQNVLWRIEHGALEGTRPQAIVLMIGINNLAGGFSAEDTVAGTRAILTSIQTRLPTTRVLLLGVLPARQDASHPLREKIKEHNRLLASLAKVGQVEFGDVGSLLLEPDGSISKATLRDFVHPTPEGYEKLSRAVAPLLAKVIGGQ